MTQCRTPCFAFGLPRYLFSLTELSSTRAMSSALDREYAYGQLVQRLFKIIDEGTDGREDYVKEAWVRSSLILLNYVLTYR